MTRGPVGHPKLDGMDKLKSWLRGRALRWTAELLLVVLVVMAVRVWQQWDLPQGQALPLAGKLVDGGAAALPDPGGQPVLVHFWASWCPVCRLEQGSIQAIARDHRVITVAMQSGSEAEVRSHLRAEGLDFAVLNDPDGQLAARWGIRGVPTSFIVDATGRIRFVEVGYTTELGLRARLWWAR